MGIFSGLHLDPHARELVCLIGAGGKTSVMFNLASALKSMGKKVLVTTTTKIFVPSKNQCNSIVFDASGTSARFNKIKPGSITCLGKELNETANKIIGVDKEVVDRLFDSRFFDWILVEGDGAKRKTIKAPQEGEPVVPEKTTLALGIIGLDALGMTVNENHVHRCTLFCTVTGAKKNDMIDENHISRLILSPKGLFKNIPKGTKHMVLLNKADALSNNEAPSRICRMIEKEAPHIHIAAVSTKWDRVIQW